ncbi:methionine--tRNA ligase [candidate division WOR-3 bacterium]|nr:methionine--tRNA ligase [candidate division WOR-3 bacterium]
MRILVTSALPYANGELHFGHLAGAYLPADIYVKYHRLKGSDVVYICGSDEHGVGITLAAQAAGLTPQQVIDRYHPSIKRSFEEFGMEFDNYSRTSLPVHHRTAQDFFLEVYKKGYLQPKTTRQLYCPSCRMFLADRYVEGTCPNCKSEGARGDQCEACGEWIEPFDLINPRCKTCGTTPEVRETTHWFFALSKFADRLKEWVGSKPNMKPNVKRFCEGWFNRGLEDRSITRDLPWGVPVPLAEGKGKVMYVWFDAPIGYISSTKEWAERIGRPDRWKDYWLDEKTKLVHFIGKDNIVFHAIVWPAMLMAHEQWVLPADIPANEFLNLEGEKISTSRNWAVWLPDYQKEFGADPLRYALAVNLPENRDVDFTWRDFQARNNNELANVLGNFVNRVAVFVKKNYSGRVPEAIPDDAQSLEVLKAIAEAPTRLGGMIDRYQIKDAAREVMTLPALGNRYFDYEAPWRTFRQDRAKCDRTMNVCMRLVSSLEVLLYPFLPFTSRKMAELLWGNDRVQSSESRVQSPERGWDDAGKPALPVELGPAEILFNKIEDSVIQVQVDKLGKQEPQTESPKPKEESVIAFDDFKKVELKVAKVLSAEAVAGATKLLKLQIDLGSEQRQIVAGVALAYKPEELVGKSIVVVCNLAPAVIRGVESNGMLLAAVNPDGMALLVPDRDIAPGTPVS